MGPSDYVDAHHTPSRPRLTTRARKTRLSQRLFEVMTSCPGCGKVVFFAERQTREGKDWHGKCLQVFLKEQGKGAKGASYTDASREQAPTKTAGTVTSAPAGKVAGAPAKFCGNCGAARALGDKFCASCGTSH